MLLAKLAEITMPGAGARVLSALRHEPIQGKQTSGAATLKSLGDI